MNPKCPLTEYKRTLFHKNRHTLTHDHDLCESHVVSKNNPFFAFLWSRMCTTLHVLYYLSGLPGLVQMTHLVA